MMNLISKFVYCFNFKYLYLIKEVIRNVINWQTYFLDFFSLSKGKFIIFYMRDSLKYMVRANTWDRGVITMIHLADGYNLNRLPLSDDSVIIDIGAHIGVFSIYISKNVGKIFAYEPIRENYKLLIENIKLNNLENKIMAHNVAVSDNNDDIKIYCSKFNTAGHSIYGKNNNFVLTQSTTLKEIFDNNKIERCELLKIDTEGCEYRILSCLPKDYFDRIKRIYLENHEFILEKYGYNINPLRKILTDNKFKLYEKDNILFADK